MSNHVVRATAFAAPRTRVLAGGVSAISSHTTQRPQSNKAQPKILNEKPPSKEEQPQDVRKHNEEMEKRYDKAHDSSGAKDGKDEKVGKEFWKGECETR